MLTTVNLVEESMDFIAFPFNFIINFLKIRKIIEEQKIEVLEQKTSPFLTLLAFEQCQDLKQIILGRCVPI